MITTFLFLMVYTSIVGAAGFLMGRVFPYPEEKPRKIPTRIKTTVSFTDDGFAKDAENLRRDWERATGIVPRSFNNQGK